MPLTPEQKQELAELRRLDQLEQKFGGQSQQEQPGTMSKVASFVGGLPQSAIDLVPGMKEKREQIEQTRSTPEYQDSHVKPDTGMGDPAYQAMGLMGPESGIKMLGSAGKGLMNFLKPAAQRSEVLSKVKDVARLEPYVAEKVNSAKEAFNQNQIAPRMEQQFAKAHEQHVPFNKDEFLGIHPDIDQKIAELSQFYDKEIPMSKALELRKDLNSNTLFKNSGPYSETVQARGKAADAGNAMRESIRSVDPSVSQLSDELKDAYNLRKAAVGSADKNPLSTISQNDNVSGLAKRGRLAAFDEQAGSDLTGLGRDVKLAQDRLRPTSVSDLFSIHGPKHIAQKLISPGGRAYDAAAEAIVSSHAGAPELSSSDKLRALLQKYSSQGSDGQ